MALTTSAILYKCRLLAQLSQLILCTLVDFILPQNLRPYVKSNKKLDIQKNPLNETGLLSTQNIRKKYG